MEAEDVLDRDSLDAWLKGRTREVGRWVSYRSAMRVLPLWASLPADVEERKHGFIDLRFLRAHLTSGVCCNYATREVKNASSSCSVAAFSSVRKAFSATFNSTSYFASSARAAASSARTSVTHRATSSTSSTSVRAYTSAAADAAAASVEKWKQIRSDCIALERDDTIDAVPLWLNAQNLCQTQWDYTRAKWQADLDYAFWLRWYEAALAGTPPNWPLLHDIALIPDGDWEKGIGHIAGLIAGIELQHAIAATPNAERIVVNPATDLLMLETVSDLSADHLSDVLDMLREAQSIFEGKGEGNHPYETIADERAVIDRAIVQYGARPKMLYNSCMRVVQRIEIKKASDDCPSNDANIDDYQSQLGSVAVKLMAHDSEVKAAVIAETETRLNRATPALRQQIVLAATALAEASEGVLKNELPEVAAIAADPNANEKDRQVAIYQTSSRLLRGWVALKDRTKGVSDHIEKHPAKYSILTAVILMILAL